MRTHTLPAFLLPYGPSKRGKTTDCIYSFPCGLFIASPGAMKPAEGLVGYMPQSVPARTLSEVIRAIRELGKGKLAGAFDAIVVDDFSLLAEDTLRTYQEKNTRNAYAAWGALRDDVLTFRDVARDSGLHVVINAHQREPETKDGRFYRGGPALPSKNLTDMVPVVCDTVVRASIEPGRQPWPGVYVCDPGDTGYVTGDRHGVCPRQAPMNLRELLNAAGYTVKRAPGLEWQEEWAEAVAQALLADKPRAEVFTKVVAHLREQKHDDRHIAWALRDGIDRAAFRKARAPLAAFGI